MEKTIGDFLEQLKVGRKQTHKNLTLYPLLSTYSMKATLSMPLTGMGKGRNTRRSRAK